MPLAADIAWLSVENTCDVVIVAIGGGMDINFLHAEKLDIVKNSVVVIITLNCIKNSLEIA
jgi:hypothetical protein